MEKRTVLRTLLYILFPLLFNFLFFLIGGMTHPTSVWIAYGFIHFAYIALLIMPLLSRGSPAAVMSLSVNGIGAVYFVVELILGTLIILLAPKGWRFSLASQGVLFILFLAILLPVLLANDKTTRDLNRAAEQHPNIHHRYKE